MTKVRQNTYFILLESAYTFFSKKSLKIINTDINLGLWATSHSLIEFIKPKAGTNSHFNFNPSKFSCQISLYAYHNSKFLSSSISYFPY